MKKISVIEIAVIIFALTTLIIYCIPQLKKTDEKEILAQVKASNAVFTSKVIEEFAKNKNAKPSAVAQKITEELNTTEINPYDNDTELYVFNKNCNACSNVEYDDNLKMIILTTLDKKGALVARTVIKPPSYVTYYKENKDKKEQN
ncbi:MAG: hypothetical protein IJ877_05290 [Candidatus Gastranaerophilales bacterium]|nr:hypothetical protein [Candidatus Gastranaerophilales bacterium]